MIMDPHRIRKYRPYPSPSLPDRTWPNNTISQAPAWCSVDLRDGNQALVQPMNLEEKLALFQLLVDVGFKEIEVGFPSASQVEHDFVRMLIERDLIPEGVVIQVLTQAREHLIDKTFESLIGVREAVVHLYNSTSTLQRQVVFNMSRQDIIALGVHGARWIRELAEGCGSRIRYEYSPESFTGTELDFALEICEAVLEVWQPTRERPVIINLPATVEMATPNVYADQIEWFLRRLRARDTVLLSLHAHNDRGTAVAATELALLAGADRVEGTLFGNGERTGNVDIVTLALNMFSQGVDPGLDFSDIGRVIEVYERCTRLPVHPRHPYAGELVYTAFSGSHQDAIKKGMDAYLRQEEAVWQVPYLPIDPRDVGRSYEKIIRINSQSGKGGVAYIMDSVYGFHLPKAMHPEFGRMVQRVSDAAGNELAADVIYHIFEKAYFYNTDWYALHRFDVLKRHIDGQEQASTAEIEAEFKARDREITLHASGNGPLDALCSGLRDELGLVFELKAYHEHALSQGSSSKAVSYIMILDERGRPFWGAGMDTDIIVSSVKALFSALNRAATVRERQGETEG
jgi:2-isopropylmalate synthase